MLLVRLKGAEPRNEPQNRQHCVQICARVSSSFHSAWNHEFSPINYADLGIRARNGTGRGGSRRTASKTWPSDWTWRRSSTSPIWSSPSKHSDRLPCWSRGPMTPEKPGRYNYSVNFGRFANTFSLSSSGLQVFCLQLRRVVPWHSETTTPHQDGHHLRVEILQCSTFLRGRGKIHPLLKNRSRIKNVTYSRSSSGYCPRTSPSKTPTRRRFRTCSKWPTWGSTSPNYTPWAMICSTTDKKFK